MNIRIAAAWTAVLVILAVPTPGAAAPGLLYAPTFRPGAATDVLVPGRPALTRGDVDAFVDLFEAAFDLSLPLAEEQDLRDRIEVDFEKADNEACRRTLQSAGKGLSGNHDAVCCPDDGCH